MDYWQMEVRLVKFNLNKPLQVLKKELQLRPNNNDLSVMSIIQGRRQTFAQVKRGIVIIALEEVPASNGKAGVDEDDDDDEDNDEDNIMEQELTLKHLALRFTGIDNDTTLLPLFTSNYKLSEKSRMLLKQLNMFRNMAEIEMGGVNGEDRMTLSNNFLKSAIMSQLVRLSKVRPSDIKFDVIQLSQSVVMESGDIRPLRYKLNVVGFFVALESIRLSNSNFQGSLSLDVDQHDEEDKEVIEYTISNNDEAVLAKGKLQAFEYGGFYPTLEDNRYSLVDRRSVLVHEALISKFGISKESLEKCWRISVIVDMYFNKALYPAVVVFKGNAKLASALVSLLCGKDEGDVGGGWCEGVLDVDPRQINMVRSLYDSRDSRNLRDDIMNAKVIY
jgi:hypothetical protein